jgi:hypothetical protein
MSLYSSKSFKDIINYDKVLGSLECLSTNSSQASTLPSIHLNSFVNINVNLDNLFSSFKELSHNSTQPPSTLTVYLEAFSNINIDLDELFSSFKSFSSLRDQHVLDSSSINETNH